MQALSKKKTGDICTIKWMFGIPDVLDFLRSRKIKEGSTVQVIQRINGGLILGMDVCDGKRRAAGFNKVVDLLFTWDRASARRPSASRCRMAEAE